MSKLNRVFIYHTSNKMKPYTEIPLSIGYYQWWNNHSKHMQLWQYQVEIKHYSILYFDGISMFEAP